jgi:methylenetetrahydrofolate dehydrogenase (NADP+)/methenyltetrahydrofolate cyclohydrolase
MLHKFNENITQAQLEYEIETINKNPNIHGCLIFRPLPSHLNDKEIRRQLLMAKDVDGITDGSMAAVYSNSDDGFVPCTAQSCMELLDYYGIELPGKNAVVVGRSLVIGKPVTMLLLSRNATVTVCHTRTKNLAEGCKKADILIAAAGRAKMITKEFVSQGQIVVDVGINVDENGDLCGDVDFASVEPIVGLITPVPKGVGPVTTSVLAKHVVTAAEKSILLK